MPTNAGFATAETFAVFHKYDHTVAQFKLNQMQSTLQQNLITVFYIPEN